MKKGLIFFIYVRYFLFGFLGLIFLNCNDPVKEKTVNLESGFVNPPVSAKPRVWWHWMNGYITKEGIRADLEWMSRIGIGGFHNFDCLLSGLEMGPMPNEDRLIYMTPEWKDAFRFTTKMADSLGFEMAIHQSPGFSFSGGPWVTPAKAMKKFVWSETRIEGGKPFIGKLRQPPSTSGAFQNIGGHTFRIISKEEYYCDDKVIAYRVPAKDVPLIELNPRVTSSGEIFTLDELTDGDLTKTTQLTLNKVGKKSWIQFEFDKPEVIQSLTIASTGSGGKLFGSSGSIYRTLEASDDGKTFRNVVNIPSGSIGQQTISFAPTRARYFRFSFNTRSVKEGEVLIAELVLHTVKRVHRFEDKAAFATATDLYDVPTPSVSSEEAIREGDVMDLTSKMHLDGTLTWNPPEGVWVVLRFGYSLTGRQNHPAIPEATGLEVDKLNAGHVRDYFNYYLSLYEEATDGLMGAKGLQYLMVDSYEVGPQNWTENMLTEFKKRRGYDMVSWLPVLAGKIVKSSEASDRFLWDFRKTLSDLMAENYYDQLAKILKERGMGFYAESHEAHRTYIADGMEAKRSSTVPMGAIWVPKEPPERSFALIDNEETKESAAVARGNEAIHIADIRESASVAHIYGQNLVAAEALTALGNKTHFVWEPTGSAWSWSPETLKPTADLALANGLNRFVIHSSVHQPKDDKKPGLTLSRYGQWFNRHETWAESAKSWITYLARSSFMMQQGRFVADIIYYYGEDNNITGLFGNQLPAIPEGYSYDFVNADALVNLLSVANGKLATPSGMRYQILALDSNSRQMSLPVLQKITELVKAGALVVGPKPVGSPSLIDNQEKFQALADQLWGDDTGIQKVGLGMIYARQSLDEVLQSLKILPDFHYTKPHANTKLLFVHRRVGNAHIYWVNNRNNQAEELEAFFRVEGKAAEIWHPVTGQIEFTSYHISNGTTRVPLCLEPNDALFVVFREKAKSPSMILPVQEEIKIETINGPWSVSFQEGRGAPTHITLEKLVSWSENDDPRVKYFSGTGSYSKTIMAPKSWFIQGQELWIDLGEVKNLAEVVVNEKSAGIVWTKPFRVNVSGLLTEGENRLEIKVTNLWVNRLIGDQQPNTNVKYSFIATKPLHKADFPLLPSGLLGPVEIIKETGH